jgi:plastocyanin
MRGARAAILGLAFLLSGCGGRPSAEDASAAKAAQRSSGARSLAERVDILDDCDPATFDAVLGRGTCVGKGETTFQQFIAELTATKTVEEWKFEDDRFDVEPGGRILAVNRGGETHTFTKVNQFGGGFVPVLNTLSGNPNPAPECVSGAVAGTFVPAGGRLTVTAPASGTVKFQCCIHPWMRAVGTVERD